MSGIQPAPTFQISSRAGLRYPVSIGKRTAEPWLTLTALVLTVLSLIAFAPVDNFFLDMLCQLRIVLFAGSVLAWFFALMLKARRPALVAGVGLLLNAYCVLQPSVACAHANNPAIKVMSANVWAEHNKSVDAFVSLVEKEQPDLICLQEVDRPWMDDLKILLPEYSYVVGEVAPRSSVIISRKPLTAVTAPTGVHANCAVRARVKVGGIDTLVVCEHTASPIDALSWYKRNAEMRRLASEMNAAKTPAVVLGDFNCTPWSTYYQQLCARANLRDAEAGSAASPTWAPAGMPALLPIDHCLLSTEFEAISHRVSDRFGSDHSPVIVEVGVKPLSAATSSAPSL